MTNAEAACSLRLTFMKAMMADKEKSYKITHRGFRVFRLHIDHGIPLDEADRLVAIIEQADMDFFQRRYQDKNETGQTDSGGVPPHGTS